MTTPDEKVMALQHARDFILAVAFEYKRIPSGVRKEAYRRLRHYPAKVEIPLLTNGEYRKTK